MTGGFLALVMFIALLFACSTEKNTFINRTYHSTTAKYNGYFNAKELVRIGLEDYRNSYREDFNEILPIDLYPNEEDVTDFYPIVDTAISKCQKVISKHSMPTASKPSQKKMEHANWIDQNWLMIGKANYIRRDYQKALKNFEYVRKFYEGRPSTYTGQLWEAKTQIKLGELTEASRSIQKLDQRIQIRLAEKKDEKSKSKILRKSSKDDEDKSPELPKDFEFEFAKTKAMLALVKEDYQKASKELKKALKEARHKEDKARISFIIGQLLQRQNKPEAREYYTQSIRKNAPFEMSFNARINRAVVSDLNDDEMIKELEDMAKEEKYLEFRDQIYYAMAQVELGRNQRKEAKTDLTQSVFYSLNNPRQKGVSYEKLGDLSFEEKDYVFAQKYYDSSAQVIPETYKNAEIIRKKADKLADLVDYMDLISFEDSVQRIAMMGENERDKFLKDVIKQLKKEEEERKQREAEKAAKMRELQQSYAAQNQGRGNKWYFSNPKAMQEGVEEYRRVWGQRENENYWRLSNKPSHYVQSMNSISDTSSVQDTTQVDAENDDVAIDELTPEILLEDVPISDSAMEQSNIRLLEALYNSGMIYKEQLEEVAMSIDQFQRVLDKAVEDKHNLLSAFQLYKIFDEKNSAKKSKYESYILDNYPNSDYANYLRDPDYFIKKKERDALAQKEYLKSVERFERGLYYPVILKAKKVISEEPDNVYRKEYFLLQAMAMGQINRDKTSLLPVLSQAIEEYPETRVAKRAQELIDLINNGVPAFESFEEDKSDLFEFAENAEFSILIKLNKGESINDASKRVDNFNREFFSRARLDTKSQIYNSDVTFIKVGTFPNVVSAKKYIEDFKKTRKHLADLRTNEVIFISLENFKTLLKEKALDAYETFYLDNY
jgi:hypothetical protein